MNINKNILNSKKNIWKLDNQTIEKIKDNDSLNFLDTKKFYKSLWSLTMPIYLQMISTLIFSIISNIVIRWVDNGIYSAIVTKTNYIYGWVSFLPTFSAVGIFIVIGNYLGENRKNEIYKILFQGWFFNIMISIILIGFLLFLKNYIFEYLLNFNKDDIPNASWLYYLNLILLLLNSINIVSQRAECALGKTKILFIILLLSSIINTIMILSLIFIINPILAIGIANIISTLFLTILMLIINIKHIDLKNIFKNNKSCWDKKIFKTILLISLPSILETLIFNIAAAFITFYITKASSSFKHNHKDILLNTLSSVQQIANFGLFMSISLGQTSSIFVSRLIGSNLPYLAKKVSWKCWLITLYTAMPFSFITIILSYPMLLIYNIPHDIILKIGIWLFVIIAFQDFGKTMNQVGLSSLRAVHYTIIPLIMAFITLLIFNFGFIALANLIIIEKNLFNFDENYKYIFLIIFICIIQAIEEIIRGMIYLLLWKSSHWIKKWNKNINISK